MRPSAEHMGRAKWGRPKVWDMLEFYLGVEFECDLRRCFRDPEQRTPRKLPFRFACVAAGFVVGDWP